MPTKTRPAKWTPTHDDVAWLLGRVDDRPNEESINDAFAAAALELEGTEGQIRAAYYKAKRENGSGGDAKPGQATGPAGEDELFAAAEYDSPELKLTTPDGQRVDEIAIGLGGEITLDRTDPEHVALIRDLHLGRGGTVTVRFESDRAGFHRRRRRDRNSTVAVVKLGASTLSSWQLDAEGAAPAEDE